MTIASNKNNELQGALLLSRSEFQLKNGTTTIPGLSKRRHSTIRNFNVEAIATALAQSRDFPNMKGGKQPFAGRELRA